MHVRLPLPADSDGRVWLHTARAGQVDSHHHDELECNLVRRGRARYVLADRRYDLGRGSIVWLFPRQEHVLVDRSPDLEMWILVIKPAALQVLVAQGADPALRLDDPDGLHCRRLGEVGLRDLQHLFSDVRDQEDHLTCNLGLTYLVLRAWQASCYADELLPTQAVHPAVERAARLLEQGDGDDALEALSRRAGLSASRLRHLFREQIGLSIQDYRNDCRLHRFLAAYRPGSRLLDVALDAGFGSYAQFHRVFRRRMGCSPREWEG